MPKQKQQSIKIADNPRAVLNEQCRSHLNVFAKRCFGVLSDMANPIQWNWHHDLICEYLQAVFKGEIRRLNINMPPRMLKTFLVSQAYCMWHLGHRPSDKIIAISYNAELTRSFHIKCRELTKWQWYLETFPNFSIESKKRNDKHDEYSNVLTQDNNRLFTTTQGGERFATSVGATITGKGSNLIIGDDLLSPAQAKSDAERNSALDWIRSSIGSRSNDPKKGCIINVQQRLHIYDTTALFEELGFETLTIPIRNKLDKDIVYSFGAFKKTYKQGEWLQENRYSEEQETESIGLMGTGEYMAQYMQDPQPAGGNMFKVEWLKYHYLDDTEAKGMNLYILVDPANSKKKTSDYTAMVVIGLNADMNYYIFDIVRDHLNLTERVDKLFELHNKWLRITQAPPIVGYEKYGMMADTHQIQEQQRLKNYTFSLKELGGKEAKKERVGRLQPLFEAGRILLPKNISYIRDGKRFNLIDEFIDTEYTYFPSSRNDDMLDAMARICDPDLNAFFPMQSYTLNSYSKQRNNNKPHAIFG